MDVVMKQMEKFISKSGCGISLCSLMTSIHFSICVTFIKNFFLTDGSMYIQITVTVTLHFPQPTLRYVQGLFRITSHMYQLIVLLALLGTMHCC